MSEKVKNRSVNGCGTLNSYYVVNLVVEPIFGPQREKGKQGKTIDWKRAHKLLLKYKINAMLYM